jgi:hypothetical protein
MIPTNHQINPAALRPNKKAKVPHYDLLSEGCDPALCGVSGKANLDARTRRGGGALFLASRL